MRGAERPAKVHWTHPFLPPLSTLSDDAARQTFVDIAEDFYNSQDITQLLFLTDNMPLAVNLIAHLVDYEGSQNVLDRWKTERTSILSNGYDKKSSLDTSITISLSSPRMTSGAKDLLSLLSVLPDGLSDIELLQSKLPIEDLLACRSVLLRTSLAYNDDNKRLKSLVPIREHMQQFCPASPTLISYIRRHFHLLLDVFEQGGGVQLKGVMGQINSNLGNLHQVLLLGLDPDNPELTDTITCIISLNSFNRWSGHGYHALMDHIPAVLVHSHSSKLKVQFITETINSISYHPIDNLELLIAQAVSHFHNSSDPVLESKLPIHSSLRLFS